MTENNGSSEHIEALLQRYFDGLYFSDVEALRGVFHPKAAYICATEEPLVHLSMDEYFDVVAERTAPASVNQARRDRIISIDLVGSDTALAKVECAIASKFFTDLLSIVREKGRWLIIAKVFHFHYVNDTGE